MDAKAGVRIGLGCAFAAWGTTMVGAACGDENGLGELISLAPIDEALCKKLVQCGCGEAFAAFDAPVPLTCEGWTLLSLLYGGDDDGDDYYYGYGYEGGYDDSFEYLPTSIDEDCVRRIAQRIDAVDCSLQFTEGEDCHDVCFPFVGPLFEGDACTSQLQCGRGLVCHRDECRDPCLVRDPAEGDRCDDRNDCGPTMTCANEDGGENGVCVAFPVEGQQCYFGECAPGLRCEQDDTDNGTCIALLPIGGACTGHLQCVTSYCPAGYCRDLPGPGQPCGAGGACGPGAQCEVDDEGDGTCVSESNACFEFFDDVVTGVGFD